MVRKKVMIFPFLQSFARGYPARRKMKNMNASAISFVICIFCLLSRLYWRGKVVLTCHIQLRQMNCTIFIWVRQIAFLIFCLEKLLKLTTLAKNHYFQENHIMFNIAKNTFKEIVRNRFLYLILFFAFVFIIFSLALGKLTIGESEKVIVDFGLGMIEIFGLIGVLFVWSQLLFKEVEWKTIFLILSKPIKRQDFILWKFFWFSCTIWLIVFFQAVLFLLMLFIKDIEITHLIVWALIFTFFKLEILLAIVFFFSTFMSNIMTIMISLMVYLIAHNYGLMIDMFSRFEGWISLKLIKILELIFPPMQALNIKDVIGSFSDFSVNFFLFNSFYSFLYITILLFFAVQIFSRKTFEN